MIYLLSARKRTHAHTNTISTKYCPLQCIRTGFDSHLASHLYPGLPKDSTLRAFRLKFCVYFFSFLFVFYIFACLTRAIWLQQ